MASRRKNLPFRRQFPLPATFKCAIDGAWLEPSKFSNKQLSKWYKEKTSANDGVTADSIGLICKTHTANPGQREIRCGGPCGAWKTLEYFSKAQRNEEGAWCMQCRLWEQNLGGTDVPTAPPNHAKMAHEIQAEASVVQERPALLTDPEPIKPPSARWKIRGVPIPDDLFALMESANNAIRADCSDWLARTVTGSMVTWSTHNHVGLEQEIDSKRKSTEQEDSSTRSAGPSDSRSAGPSAGPSGQSDKGKANESSGPFAPGSHFGDRSSLESIKGKGEVTSNEGWGAKEWQDEAQENRGTTSRGAKWSKGDTRRIFHTGPTYAARPEPFDADRHDDEDSDDTF